jgi:hypothetical protein
VTKEGKRKMAHKYVFGLVLCLFAWVVFDATMAPVGSTPNPSFGGFFIVGLFGMGIGASLRDQEARLARLEKQRKIDETGSV